MCEADVGPRSRNAEDAMTSRPNLFDEERYRISDAPQARIGVERPRACRAIVRSGHVTCSIPPAPPGEQRRASGREEEFRAGQDRWPGPSSRRAERASSMEVIVRSITWTKLRGAESRRSRYQASSPGRRRGGRREFDARGHGMDTRAPPLAIERECGRGRLLSSQGRRPKHVGVLRGLCRRPRAPRPPPP